MMPNGVHPQVPKKCTNVKFADQFSAARKRYKILFSVSLLGTLVFDCDMWGHSESIVRVIDFELFVVLVFLPSGIANVSNCYNFCPK